MQRFTLSLNILSNLLTIICAIHCALLPILITILPFFGLKFGFSPLIETSLVISIVIFCSINLYRGFTWHHHNKFIIVLFLVGLITLISSIFLSDSLEYFVHIIGAMIVTISQLWNTLLCRKCNKCQQS